MPVPMVNVGVVRMRVCQRLVPVRVNVRLRVSHGRVGRAVGVPVVLVVHVSVLVKHRLVDVLVLVPLRKVQPDAHRHQQGGDGEAGVRALAEDEQ